MTYLPEGNLHSFLVDTVASGRDSPIKKGSTVNQTKYTYIPREEVLSAYLLEHHLIDHSAGNLYMHWTPC